MNNPVVIFGYEADMFLYLLVRKLLVLNLNVVACLGNETAPKEMIKLLEQEGVKYKNNLRTCNVMIYETGRVANIFSNIAQAHIGGIVAISGDVGPYMGEALARNLNMLKSSMPRTINRVHSVSLLYKTDKKQCLTCAMN